jgi:hypothetical protein
LCRGNKFSCKEDSSGNAEHRQEQLFRPKGVLKRMRICCAAFTLALIALGTASASEPRLANPYMGIPLNNPFRLVAPKPLPPEIQPQAPPDGKIRLAGISSVGGHPRALLEIQHRSGENITRPILQERDEFGDMKVLGISPEEGSILVKIGPKTEKLLISAGFDKDLPRLPQLNRPLTYRK